jgi:hypothetical protein
MLVCFAGLRDRYFLAAAFWFLPALASATTITIAANHRGTVEDDAFFHLFNSALPEFNNSSSGPQSNYVSSLLTFPSGQIDTKINNWFAFDLSSVRGRMVSAVLRIDNPFSGELGGQPVQYTMSDVSTLPPLLAATSDVNVFSDLQSGTQYGQVVIGPETDGRAVNISLDVAALTSLNTTQGEFAIGGAITSPLGNGISMPQAPTELTQMVFGFSGPSGTTDLVLDVQPVPEPISAALLGVGPSSRR